MIAKTKQKITWYPDNFNPVKDNFFAMITGVSMDVNYETSEFQLYRIAGEYFYTDKGAKKQFKNFNFTLTRKEVDGYLLANGTKKGGAASLDEAFYNLLLEQMAKDLSNYIQIGSSELELQDNLPKNLKFS